MAYPRVLTVQDISCVGQCSLTVALPIISACGAETCVLPSAVLSNHTAKGFAGFTFRDLTDDMPKIAEQWQKNGLFFDALYTGYLGSARQIDYVRRIIGTVLKEGGRVIVDPAMADHGKLYVGFDMDFVAQMRSLCAQADYVLPNITEACLMTGLPYREEYDRAYVDEVLAALRGIGCRNIVLTGIGYDADHTGVVVSEDGGYAYYAHVKYPESRHGTGDIFASAFVGALVGGRTALRAARIAGDFTAACIGAALREEGHWYGAAFEPVLPELIRALKEE